MTTKLTLRLNETVIKNAKRAARSRGISLSNMVSDYFKAVSAEKKTEFTESPILAEIAGILSPGVDEKKLLTSYRRRLEEKYR